MLRLNGVARRVIGVMPSSFDPTLSGEQLWVPAAFTPADRAMHDEHYIDVIGLLKPGVTTAQATAELTTFMQELVVKYPDANTGRGAAVVDFSSIVIGPVRDRLVVLFGAVFLVLLIACTNVASLLLARAAARMKELAIRAALGAGRRRVVRQLLTESAVLAGGASALGIALAWAMVRALVTLAPPGTPRLANVHIDPLVMLFAAVLALASAILAALVPAWRATATDPQQELREGGRGAAQVRDHVRNVLVVGEVALALTLLVGAGLFVRTVFAMQRVLPGFDPSGVLMARASLPPTDYRDATRRIIEMPRALSGRWRGWLTR